MKKKKLQCSVPTSAGRCVVPDFGGLRCEAVFRHAASDTDSAASAALPVKAMNAKRVDENPYMAKSDATFTTTATIPTLRMKFCRLASIRRSMFPMKNKRERFACHLL